MYRMYEKIEETFHATSRCHQERISMKPLGFGLYIQYEFLGAGTSSSIRHLENVARRKGRCRRRSLNNLVRRYAKKVGYLKGKLLFYFQCKSPIKGKLLSHSVLVTKKKEEVKNKKTKDKTLKKKEEANEEWVFTTVCSYDTSSHEHCMSAVDSYVWYFDSGATKHITSQRSFFSSLECATTGNTVTCANNSSYPMMGSGKSFRPQLMVVLSHCQMHCMC
ncbi:hypothetical protein KP509_16G081300 [Ceratopteris richardii]|uniref:Retrovirus-related Pol polyprotein from transposon TNT 1-94-like beta-barrel domain-containing protein n=1 Tax=Ceratopteris richardii TaxID=49495 RepID=A0A8T2T0C5_CERRI|nr:hypothetical protein KP509_16G081300 [Ceratopteris richardii]